MKKIYKQLLVIALALLGGRSMAQVSAYVFNQYSTTYVAVTGGTVLGNSTSDDDYWANATNPTLNQTTGPGIPIGFTFMLNGIPFDRIGVQCNGFIAFGQSTITPNPVDFCWNGIYGQGISGTPCGSTYAPLQYHVSALSDDLQGNGGDCRVQTIGTAPNRICVVQFTKYRQYAGSDMFDFQIRLSETSNAIDVIYANWITVITSNSAQVGLRGGSTTDYNNRNVTSPNLWSTSIAGTNNAATASWNSGLHPAQGQVYEWLPPVPCNGTPVAGAAVTPNYQVCYGSVTQIVSTPTPTDVGYTYQWQSSTSTAFGPWTSIPSATNAAYTSTNTVNTYYSVVRTCTFTNLSSTSAGAEVVVAATTTSNVPYYEGFEGVAMDGQLPNCSWAVSSSTNNITTHTSVNPGYLFGQNSSHYISFNGNTSGTRYLYTNGVQLYPGVTYSAAAWYLTEYSGLTSFSDLSLLLGTAQTSVGLVPLVSTGGAVVASQYSLLSNTFQVTTAGLYYLAMRATNTSNSYNLSLDNISITAPCSLNSPTLAVVGLTTVCLGNPINLTASGADSYTWSTGSSLPNVSVPSLNAGINNLTVMGTNSLSACTTTLVKAINVLAGPVVSAFMNDPNNGVCPGETAVIYAVGSAVGYTWSTTGLAGANTTVQPTGNTTYTVLGSNATGCITSVTIAVSLKSAPNVAGTSSKPAICVGEGVVLTGSDNTLNYQWISNAAVILGSPVTAYPMQPTNYQLVGVDPNTGCSGTALISVNVAACLGISNLTSSNNGINVYPNPNNGEFTVELNNTIAKTVELIDVTGRVLQTNTEPKATVSFNIANLSNGIYYVKVQSADKTTVVKVVKQ